MNFQILKLIIWPKNSAFPPRVVEFKLGVLNVITGASRTGKSAIIPIIDYCLASSDCNIPIDTIRDHASWYGVVAKTDVGEILFAREVPDGRKVSNNHLLDISEKISIPPIIEEPQQTTEDVKSYLNTLAKTPNFKLNEEDQGYVGRLSFRDLVALSFQSQDIVANQNILFYKAHAHEHRERLRNWFPYILGAETLTTLKARNQLKSIESELKKLHREFSAAKEISESWLANIRGHLQVADEYGLLGEPIPKDAEISTLLHLAKSVVDEIPQTPSVEVSNISRSNIELASLSNQEEELSIRIGELKKRLSDLDRLKDSFGEYGGAVRKRVDRLHISEWLIDLSNNSSDCPFCGGETHPNSKAEIEKINAAFKENEAKVSSLENVAPTLDKEEIELRTELELTLERRKVIAGRFDVVRSNDSDAQKKYYRQKEMHIFLGHLTASLEMVAKLTDEGELAEKITQLEEEAKLLRIELSAEKVGKALESSIRKISQLTLDRLKTLDVEQKYNSVAPRFSIKELGIFVLSDDGDWHLLAEVGSASNWVSFHIAFICAMQEYLLSRKESVTPTFAIFDQPSQVYFPRSATQGELTTGDTELHKDEDKDAVRKIFRTLADSVQSSEGEWQAIVLDHAAQDIYGHIDGVHEVEEWRGSNKLIPSEWINATK
ncbi:MAG: DUF3732 domain-containing protein [Opitutaceae bacterium]